MKQKEDIITINFKASPKENFELITLQELFQKKLDHLLTQPQRITFNIMFLFTRGKGNHQIDFENHSYQKRDLVFVSSGQVQRFEINLENDGFMLIFTNDFICSTELDFKLLNQARIFDRLSSPKITLSQLEFAHFNHLINKIQEEYQKENSWINNEILKNQLRIFLLEAERIKQNQNPVEHSNRYQKTFFEFKNLVEDNFYSQRKTIFYAEKMAISSKKLNYIVQSITNQTTKQFIDQRTILEIKRLLTHSELSIKEISYQLNFDEPTNLVKYFKKNTQQIPSQFRKSFEIEL